MRILLAFIFCVVFGCNANFSKRESGKVSSYPFRESDLRLKKGALIAMDIYDPVSISLLVNTVGKIELARIMTHNVKDGRLVEQLYHFDDERAPIGYEHIVSIISTSDSVFVNQGLDGDEFWVKELSSPDSIYKFWSPSSQIETKLGREIQGLYGEISETIRYDSLKNEFLNELPRGRYWNFGEGVLVVK